MVAQTHVQDTEIETYFDDDVEVELPIDRMLRYEKLKSMWANRMTRRELAQFRKAYGIYEWGIEVHQIEAIRDAIRLMEYDDQQALKRWCEVVRGSENAQK